MNDSIVNIIHKKYDTMTKKQRTLADCMLADPDAMAFITLKELCEKSGVAEMTILHMCTVLGLKNYNELKYEFRKYLGQRTRIEVQEQNLYKIDDVPSYELNDKDKLMMQICQEESDAYQMMMSSINTHNLFYSSEMILDAENTIICARGSSYIIAQFLSMRMSTLGIPSVVVNTELNDSIQSALPLFNKNTLGIFIALPDYYFMTCNVCEFAKQRNSKIISLTDSLSESPIAKYGDIVLTAPANTRLFLNTLGPMLTLVNLLTTALNIEKSSRKNNKFTSPEEFSELFRRKQI